MAGKNVRAVSLRYGVFDLGVRRCPDGYEINGGMLRPRSRATAEYQLEPGAYLDFADLALTRETLRGTFVEGEPQSGARMVWKPDDRAILAFANEHGLLGTDTDSEPVAVWRRAVGEMRVLLYTLRDNVIETGEIIVGEGWAQRERDKLRDTINRRLQGVTLQVKGGPPRFQKQIVSRDLLAALWTQAVEALTTDHTFRPCVVCGRWMEITPESRTGHRFTQRTCSGACRVAVFTRIKRAAVAMRAEGGTLKQIARRLRAAYGWKSAAPERQLEIWFRKGEIKQ
jgi:hypothetical protein